MDLLAPVLQVVILLASLVVWGKTFQQWGAGQELVNRDVPAVRPRPMLAIWLTFSWILYSCLPLKAGEQAVLDVETFSETKAVLLLVTIVLVKFTTWCILLVSLTRLGEQRLTRFGIDGRHPTEEVRVGLWGYLLAVMPVLAVNLAFMSFRTEDNQHILLQILQSQQSLPLVGLMILSAVVMAPLEEELLYRVIFQGTLQRVMSPLMSILISASVFSAVHGFPDALGLFPLAVILGYLYWRTGSYLTVVTTHATFNGVSVLMTLLSPDA